MRIMVLFMYTLYLSKKRKAAVLQLRSRLHSSDAAWLTRSCFKIDINRLGRGQMERRGYGTATCGECPVSVDQVCLFAFHFLSLLGLSSSTPGFLYADGLWYGWNQCKKGKYACINNYKVVQT